MTSLRSTLSFGIFFVVTAACSPFVTASSSAPPTRFAELNNDTDLIRISKGVAFAVDCRDAWGGGPCEKAVARTHDAHIARVLPAHIEKYRDAHGNVADQHASANSAFVVLGISPGRTTLRIDSDDGDRTFEVVVE